MTYKYPKSFWLIAEQIGYARTVVNQKILDDNPRFDRGEKNTHVDTVGILGELIAMDYLTNKNIHFEMAKLLDFYPSKNADFVFKNKKIDVKSTFHFPNAHILVNEEAHKKGLDKIDMYWFIYILDKKNAEFYFVDYDDVSNWKCKLMKYTNAFCIKRENLKP
jgi:hypothetical protein|tara:strand:+ start:6477 stop:6965 length:489 start_codon:yes stop_codon:yes gene_type:complete